MGGGEECMNPAYNLYTRRTGFYEGQKHLRQDCMKVRNFIFKILERSDNFASGFHEGLKTHQDFMQVKKMHQDCVKV